MATGQAERMLSVSHRPSPGVAAGRLPKAAGRVARALPGLASLMVLLVLTLMAAADRDWYVDEVTGEDGPIEWLTALCLLLGAVVALISFVRCRTRGGGLRWFFAACAALLLLGCLEELSWGQRLFEIESPRLFKEYNRQDEINAHNVLDRVMRKSTGLNKITSTDLAAGAVLAYGVLLPLLKRLRWGGGGLLSREWLRLPPVALAPLWILGVLLCLIPPLPNGGEHAELFWSAGLLLFMASEARTAFSTR